MIDKMELCQKIKSIYPDIGECGIDLDVAFDSSEKAWVVELYKNNQRLKTFIEDIEAELCMDGKQCVSLGIEIAQLRSNLEKMNAVQ